MAWVALVILLALAEYAVFVALVGWARDAYAVAAPASTDHPTFERYVRVQQNTLELLIIFIPPRWLYGTYMSARVAALLGLVFVASRALYAVSYVRNPKTRMAGVASTGAVLIVLLVGSAFGVIKGLGL